MEIRPSETALYQHSVDGTVFYVGCGKGQRAFEVTRRNAKWKEIVSRHGSFSVHIVGWFQSCDDAFAEEAKMIREIKPAANMMHNGYSKSDEFKRMMSAVHAGKVVSDETRAKMRASMAGRTAHNKGKPMSQEQKDRLSALARGKLGVVNKTTGVKYHSLREASRETGIPRTTLRCHLSGRLKHAGGHEYCYG